MNFFRWLFSLEILNIHQRESVVRPELEGLEDRVLLATYTVTNLSGDSDTNGSLPWAVKQANETTPNTLDFINFNISGTGAKIIYLTDTLNLTDQVVIDATTQPEYGDSPVIHIHGTNNLGNLFVLQNDTTRSQTSSGSTIQGVGLYSFTTNAVAILSTSVGNFIQNNHIGFYNDATSGATYLNRAAFPSAFSIGVAIQSSFNTVRDNTISGVYNGVTLGEDVLSTWSGTTYLTNSISTNRIGTDPTGSTATGYGNDSDGIFLGSGARENFLGPTNVISGNASSGVELLAASNVGNVVFQNSIGTNSDNSAVIGNGELGVLLSNGANGNAIGGPFGGNVISGNTLCGIALGTTTFGAANSNFVQNNILGLNGAQSSKLGSQELGITVTNNSTGNAIESNVIAGNDNHGVVVENAESNNISENWIGQNASDAAFSNGGLGIALLSGANFNFIHDNVFGSNESGSLYVDPAAVGNSIQ